MEAVCGAINRHLLASTQSSARLVPPPPPLQRYLQLDVNFLPPRLPFRLLSHGQLSLTDDPLARREPLHPPYGVGTARLQYNSISRFLWGHWTHLTGGGQL